MSQSNEPGIDDFKDVELTPAERKFEKIITPFEQFIRDETASGMLLMFCTVLALIFANSFISQNYEHILHAQVGIQIGGWSLGMTLHHFINDVLMTLFFFVVGLEIKREVLAGELSQPAQAMLPIAGAVGGMLVPALLYWMINGDGPGARGWGVPMATDIAFVVGIMVLLGKRVPPSLFTFLIALAIVDDLGAVAVIAIFYTDTLSVPALTAAGLLLAMLIGMNYVGVRRPLPYFIVGTVLWYAMYQSGVHATVAGVLTAWTIPAKSTMSPKNFAVLAGKLLERYQKHVCWKEQSDHCVQDQQQRRGIIQALEDGVHAQETPLQRLEHNLHIPVAFLVIPIFALANAGIPIDLSSFGDVLSHPVALGVILGLVVGKTLGIAGMAWIAVKLGIAELPKSTGMSQIVGAAMLGGVGFTMSIFIAELGFTQMPHELLMAKTGILFASLLAGVTGYVWLRCMARERP